MEGRGDEVGALEDGSIADRKGFGSFLRKVTVSSELLVYRRSVPEP